MAQSLELKFDPNQPHQLDAIRSVVDLFEGLSPYQVHDTGMSGEIIGNLPRYQTLDESWLYDNLLAIQKANQVKLDDNRLFSHLETDEGMQLEFIEEGYNTWRYPNFTIEMETGTGKTYAYLRTIYELRQRYGFSKFIIVVPSIAIYEGVIKNFTITRNHFRALYGNETVNLIQYNGSRLSQLRAFAASTVVEVMVITLASFNSKGNVIFKASEQLPGERLPYQYIQETRPILILDEPQNMESQTSKEALRSLHPLFALRYSATHKENPNLVYQLTPFDAYRLNLVKKIQVFGVTERDNFNQPFLRLEEIKRIKGRRGGLTAIVRTYVDDRGRMMEKSILLKHGENLHAKTGCDVHASGYIVSEINARDQFVEFENGIRLSEYDSLGPAKRDIFKAQIRQTIEQHMKMQERMYAKGIKVLSLFFIDRVANYVNDDGMIKVIFDEEYNRLKRRYPYYQDSKAEDVRGSYFAKSKPKKGEDEGHAIDTEGRNKAQREAERAAFELIMRDKERLLSFDEPTCFIFAHSALKEGWDNPNVFQICTLNQTVSVMKKRQEIGRGLRIAVDQTGERVFNDDVNVLSVVANESYQSYASTLQTEYVESGQAAPPKPTNATRAAAKRNDRIFNETQAFRDFWAKLQQHTTYSISVNTPALVQACIDRINNRTTPQAIVVIERGEFIVTEYTLELLSVSDVNARLRIRTSDTNGNTNDRTASYALRTDLSRELHDDCLRGYKIVEIVEDGEDSRVVFGNGQTLYHNEPIVFQSEQGQRPVERAQLTPDECFPVPDFLTRAAKETGLTRRTINTIFKGLTVRKQQSIFSNPEGFIDIFITEVKNELADHVADRLVFRVAPAPTEWGYDLEDLFPAERMFPQRELVESSAAGLYDQTQIDSDVEQRFLENLLNGDDDVIFYFKFPPAFKIDFPKVIGNYNPDWGIARYDGDDHRVTLELVRETKGSTEIDALQFPHEKRKIFCAQKHFNAIGIDFRVISDQTLNWWRSWDAAQLTLGDD